MLFTKRPEDQKESKSATVVPENPDHAGLNGGPPQHTTDLKPVQKVPHKESDDLNLTAIGYRMRNALFLAVAYSANIGGTGVVTGTTPNLILIATLQE